MRVAAYYRVSTEEQRKFGLSVDAQIAEIREWAKDNNHEIVKEYNDAGLSARQPISKRKQLQQLLNDLEFIHIDLIVFTRLDRWFRSVKEYYKVQEILEKYNVAWQAIDEDYSTADSVSRFRVNVMLSVAEMEADKTADRIKSVFDLKIQRGEWLAPQGLCLGYSIENKHLVPNDDAEAVRAAFQYYADNHSVVLTADFLRENYGIDCLRSSLQRVLKNRLYIGEYRGNPGFCEPIVQQELFDRVQSEITRRSVRHNQSGRIYLFAGLCKCSVCGWNMGGMTTKKDGHEYRNYRCTNSHINHRCTNRTMISEKKIESQLLERIVPELDALISETKVNYKPKKQPKKRETVNIQAKLERLKDLYIDGVIDKEQFTADREKLLALMPQPIVEPTQPDYDSLRELIGRDFQTRYALLNATQQRALWRTLIDHIEIDESRNLRLFFKA